jgi:1-acyl-sn-glycerol-3-phosphate acyltransferase
MSPPSDLRDDPVALRSSVACAFFRRIMRREVARSFRALRLAEPGAPNLPDGRAVIVFSNHPSWWDPAVFILLAEQAFPGRLPFGPMEAGQLERYRIMRRVGVFGVDTATRGGATRFLDVSTRLLSDPHRMLWVTAQGRFADPRQRPLELRGGVARLLARIPGAVGVPLALEYPFWSEKRPEALAAFGRPVELSADQPRGAGAEAVEQALEATMDRLATLSAARDPAAFRTVVDGARGIGGVYGAWWRVKAAVQGVPYRPDHLPDAGGVGGGREARPT